MGLKKAWKKVKKAVKKVLKVAAVVAVVAFAPQIAAMVASAVPALAPVMTGAYGTTLVGAGIGGLTAAATGENVLKGALIGGTLGFASPTLGAGTPGGFLGSGVGASPAVLPGQLSTGALATGQTVGTGLTAAGATLPPAAGVAAGAGTAAAAAPATFLGTLGKVASIGGTALSAISAIQQAKLAASMADGSTEGLTPEELALREQYQSELEELASTNRAQYDYLVAQGRNLLGRGTANPELAYGQAAAATQRAGLDVSRGQAPGMASEMQRRTAIEAARAGGGAAVEEQMRADNAQAAGIQSVAGLGSAPQGASAALMLQADADRKRRQEEEAERLRRMGASSSAAQTAADKLYDLGKTFGTA